MPIHLQSMVKLLNRLVIPTSVVKTDSDHAIARQRQGIQPMGAADLLESFLVAPLVG
jgi:hypothetical protein